MMYSEEVLEVVESALADHENSVLDGGCDDEDRNNTQSILERYITRRQAIKAAKKAGNSTGLERLEAEIIPYPDECNPSHIFNQVKAGRKTFDWSHITTCLEKAVNVKKGCAECVTNLHRELIGGYKSIGCMPFCSQILQCDFRNPLLTDFCWPFAASCVKCLHPPGVRFLRCLGAKETDPLIHKCDQGVKSVLDGSFARDVKYHGFDHAFKRFLERP